MTFLHFVCGDCGRGFWKYTAGDPPTVCEGCLRRDDPTTIAGQKALMERVL